MSARDLWNLLGALAMSLVGAFLFVVGIAFAKSGDVLSLVLAVPMVPGGAFLAWVGAATIWAHLVWRLRYRRDEEG
jgi:uncharacterized membrane protein